MNVFVCKKKLVISQTIVLVKNIRAVSGLGLRESKDLADQIKDGEEVFIQVLNPENLTALLNNEEILVRKESSENDLEIDDIFQKLLGFLVKEKAIEVGEQVLKSYKLYIEWADGFSKRF